MVKTQRGLEGIRVVEFGQYISGPYAGALLCELGAEVIKIEVPPDGDPFRGWGTQETVPANFRAYNAGKASLCVDIRHERQWFEDLLQSVDVVVSNLRPSAQRGLGVSFEQLRNLNQRLIVCNISGFGPDGPLAERPCYDGVAQAMSGLMSLLTDHDSPECIGPAFSDLIAGLYACLGIMSALIERHATGVGRAVDISMVGASMSFIRDGIGRELVDGEPADKYARSHASQSYAFSGKDGLPFVIHLSSPTKFVESLCEAVGRPELLEDERFMSRQKRIQNYDLFRRELQLMFAAEDRSVWLNALSERDVPCSAMHSPGEAAVNELLTSDIDADAIQRFEASKDQWLGDLPVSVDRRVPNLGADNSRFGLKGPVLDGRSRK